MEEKATDIEIKDEQNGTLYCTFFNEDGTLKVTSFSIYYKKYVDEVKLQEGWPAVESALVGHGISCELNLVEDSMTVSATKRIKSFKKAMYLLKLLSVGVFPDKAIRILRDKMKCFVIEAEPSNGRTRKERAINKEKFCKWMDRIKGPDNYILKAISLLTDCGIRVCRFSVSAIGPHRGIYVFRNIVLDCIKDKHSPLYHLRRLKRNQKGLKETGKKLKNQTGITPIMEAVRFMKTQIICRAYIYTNFMKALHRIQNSDVLEMIADKFSSSDSPEVHGDVSETICALIKFAPPGISSKLSSASFIRRLFRFALEDSRPKSVLVNALSVCMSLLDPRRFTLGEYEHMHGRQITCGSRVTANPETVVGMLEILGDLLKLLDVSSVDNVSLTTYGKLQPPLGNHRLKILEFISLLLTVGSEAVEKELIRLGAVERILDLFFKYPFNNCAHHHIENIIVSCFESKNASLVQHLLLECDLVGKILQVEKDFLPAAYSDKPTISVEGRDLPRIGNIGHITRISNKIIQLGNRNSEIQAYLQENCEWIDWHTNVLSKRNRMENVWACGGPCSDKSNRGKHKRKKEIPNGIQQPHSIQSSPPSSPLSKPIQRPTVIVTGAKIGWHVKY